MKSHSSHFYSKYHWYITPSLGPETEQLTWGEDMRTRILDVGTNNERRGLVKLLPSRVDIPIPRRQRHPFRHPIHMGLNPNPRHNPTTPLLHLRTLISPPRPASPLLPTSLPPHQHNSTKHPPRPHHHYHNPPPSLRAHPSPRLPRP